MTDFFDYEVIQKKGCPDKIIIHDIYKDYIKIPRKGCDIDGVLLIRKEREKVIQDFLLKEVFINPEEDIFLFYVDILKRMWNKIDKKLFNI